MSAVPRRGWGGGDGKCEEHRGLAAAGLMTAMLMVQGFCSYLCDAPCLLSALLTNCTNTIRALLHPFCFQLIEMLFLFSPRCWESLMLYIYTPPTLVASLALIVIVQS